MASANDDNGQHYRDYFDPSQYLCAADIDGKGDLTVTIEKAEHHTLTGERGKKVTLFVSSTRNGEGETVPCIRIRPEIPK